MNLEIKYFIVSIEILTFKCILINLFVSYPLLHQDINTRLSVPSQGARVGAGTDYIQEADSVSGAGHHHQGTDSRLASVIRSIDVKGREF